MNFSIHGVEYENVRQIACQDDRILHSLLQFLDMMEDVDLVELVSLKILPVYVMKCTKLK